MDCNQLIAILLTGIAGLVTALIWVVKTGRKDVMNTMNRCSNSLDRNTDVMGKVVELLSNWRGH